MSRYLRSAAIAALTLAAATVVAGSAGAQTYSRLVVFGDSLSDNGNLFAVTAGTQPPAAAGYFQGRFSNGPVFTELLGFNALRFTAGAPVTGSINYAFGGARTEDIAGPPPGLRRQLSTYLASGGQFGANDLVSVLGGANNLFQQIQAFSLLPAGNPALANPTGFVQPTALAAAADINFMVNNIAAAGAGTILVGNLPRLGITPQFRPTPAAALADYAGQTFNSALLAGLTNVAAARPNSNIILLDLYKVSDVILADPTRFGLTNATDSCLNPITFVRCSTPDTYLYWDGVHPTAAGHRLLASLANDYLYYGDIGAQSVVQGETSFRQHEDLLDMASDGMSGRDGWDGGTRMTFTGIADSVDTDARGVVGESEAQGFGARVAIDHAMDANTRMAVGFGFRDTDVESGAMDFNLRSYSADASFGWRSDALFVTSSLSAAIDQFDDILRTTSLAPIVHSGETGGGSVGGRVQAGLWFDMGGIALSPRAAITTIRSHVDRYQETGAAAEYDYRERVIRESSAEITLRAEGGSEDLAFFVEGGYRDTLGGSNDPVRTSIRGNTAKVLTRSVEDAFGGSMLASAGVEGRLGPVSVALSYRGRFGDNADSHMGGITFSLPLQ